MQRMGPLSLEELSEGPIVSNQHTIVIYSPACCMLISTILAVLLSCLFARVAMGWKQQEAVCRKHKTNCEYMIGMHQGNAIQLAKHLLLVCSVTFSAHSSIQDGTNMAQVVADRGDGWSTCRPANVHIFILNLAKKGIFTSFGCLMALNSTQLNHEHLRLMWINVKLAQLHKLAGLQEDL